MLKKGLLIIFIFILSLQINNLTAFAGQEEGIYGDKLTFLSSGDSFSEVIAEGNVLMIYHELKITADQGRFNADSKKVSLTGEVVLDNGTYQIRGDKLTGDLSEEEFQLTGGIVLTGTDLTLTAANLNFQNKQRKAVFKGEPYLIYKEVEARAEVITFDLEEESALLEGNVHGQQEGHKFSADRLVINSEDKLILSGQAKLLFEGKGEK